MKTVFLDRDGTINVDFGYVFTRERLELISGAANAVSQLKILGFQVIVVSNQSAVGRGMCQVGDVEATNNHLQLMLRAENEQAVIDKIFYCPHLPEDNCLCRKPGIGLVSNLGQFSAKDLNNSWVVGDKLSDLEFGLNLGIPRNHCLFLGGGESDSLLNDFFHFQSLAEAVEFIVGK